MEEEYTVRFGNKVAGKVRVYRQGLYYRFICRCQLTGEVICRLHVRCDTNQENLGIVVPFGDDFGLDTRVPIKKLGEGKLEFFLLPKHEKSAGKFVPIYPEEPFAYIARLKNAFLERQNGKVGITITAGTE